MRALWPHTCHMPRASPDQSEAGIQLFEFTQDSKPTPFQVVCPVLQAARRTLEIKLIDFYATC